MELFWEHNVNGLSTIIDLIRNKEKTILELDDKILEEISEDEQGEGISEADRYTDNFQTVHHYWQCKHRYFTTYTSNRP